MPGRLSSKSDANATYIDYDVAVLFSSYGLLVLSQQGTAIIGSDDTGSWAEQDTSSQAEHQQAMALPAAHPSCCMFAGLYEPRVPGLACQISFNEACHDLCPSTIQSTNN